VRALAATLAALLTAAGLPTGAAAQPATAPPVSLADVLGSTLGQGIDLALAATDVDFARGTLWAAAAPFDSALGLGATASQSYQFSPPTAPPSTLMIRQLTLAADWSRLFRNGISLVPQLRTTRTVLDTDPRLHDTEASARLLLTVPLLRDWGGAITAAPERSARRLLSAAQQDERGEAAQIMLRASAAYWGYVAARRRAAVHAASEQRAIRTAEETAALVKGDERTRADLVQAQGHLASRRAARIAADAQVVASWQEVALLTGAQQLDGAQLPEPSTDFPAPGPEAPADAGGYLAAALAHRPELPAAEQRLQAAAVELEAARSDLRPRLDLQLGGGYTSHSRGPGADRLAQPLYRDVPGPEASVSLRLELPIERTGARGRLAQRSASYQRQRLLRAEAERRIRIGVSAALERVRRSRLGLRDAEEAVRLLEQTVNNEKHRFQVGTATLFSVIQAEESLTSALLGRIEGQRDFAVALASLRVETSSVFPDGPNFRQTPGQTLAAQLTSLPAEKASSPR
jgi:outer membrane protein TolC